MLVSGIKTLFAQFKRDISDVSDATFITWCDYMNKYAYRLMQGIDPERFVSTTTFTVSSEPQTSALPADFDNISTFEMGFYYVDTSSDDTTIRLNRTAPGSRQKGYYITGTNVVFTGINDSSIYKLRYIPSLTTLTALSDTVVVPDGYEKYARDAVDVLYNQWNDDKGSESVSDFRFARVMDEFATHVKKEPYSYSIGDFTGAY